MDVRDGNKGERMQIPRESRAIVGGVPPDEGLGREGYLCVGGKEGYPW
ncbi:MAG: hypothetical protein QXK42_01780 [Candidatus Korarchaeum sp.]